MSHQDGLGNNGAEATGLSKPDDGDDRMQKKSENVAHGRNGIKLNKLENSGHLQFAYDTILGPFGGRFSGVHSTTLLERRRFKNDFSCGVQPTRWDNAAVR